jgi:hypothetical protein
MNKLTKLVESIVESKVSNALEQEQIILFCEENGIDYDSLTEEQLQEVSAEMKAIGKDIAAKAQAEKADYEDEITHGNPNWYNQNVNRDKRKGKGPNKGRLTPEGLRKYAKEARSRALLAPGGSKISTGMGRTSRDYSRGQFRRER